MEGGGPGGYIGLAVVIFYFIFSFFIFSSGLFFGVGAGIFWEPFFFFLVFYHYIGFFSIFLFFFFCLVELLP